MALRSAIRDHRDQRRESAGLSGREATDFYRDIITNLEIVAKDMTMDSYRFKGWKNYMVMNDIFGMVADYKKMSMILSKMANVDFSFISSDIADVIHYYANIREYLKISSLISEDAAEKIANLTDLEAYQNFQNQAEKVISLFLSVGQYGTHSKSKFSFF